jgi:hypothetical protein
MNSVHQTRIAVLAAVVLAMGACRKTTDTSTAPNPQAAPAAAASAPKERHHRMTTGGVSPLIVSMSPESIPIRDGHVPMGRFSLIYEIDNVGKATSAYISVYSRGVGELQRHDVDLQARGQIEFFIDGSNFDLGPTVRFRVHCPSGDSDWFLMGSDPLQFPQKGQIAGVDPGYVETRGRVSAGGFPVSISGVSITRECTPEAQVDSSAVELKDVVATNQRINLLLPYEALQGRPVAARYLEVNLVVYGPGMPAEDVYPLNLVE